MFYAETVAQVGRESQIANQRENTARSATQIFTQVSVGVGQFRLGQPLDFDIPFVTEPAFTQGAALARHDDTTNWHDPIGTAGLRGWLRNDRGHFVGAWLYLAVTLAPIDPDYAFDAYPAVSMIHNLAFFGVAFKPLPAKAQLEIISLEPKPVVFGGMG